uniref:WSN domain-containing protein n=1 Tax=Caenorhabditis tropicalis TaxID=1561998 RepID=A0A1I7UXL9_9PELO
MWNIVEMKKYKERFEGDFIDKIENSQETVIRIRNELMKIPSSTNSDELLNLLKPMVKTDKIPDDLDRKVNYLVTDLDKISRSDFSDYFSLKKALGTWRLRLELSKTFKGMSGKWDTVLKNLEVIKSKFSDMKESSSAHRRHFNMPVILRSLLLIADQMKATPKEHRILPTQFSDSDMENDWFRFDLLQSQQLFPLEEMIETIRKMEKIVSDVYPNWKETSKILGTEEEIIDSIENTQKYGDQIRVLNISEAEMNATIECISSLDFDNIVLPKITATLNFNRDAAPKMPSINKAVLEALFEQLTSMIEKSNILKVYGCISQSVMYKLERVIRFLNSANGSMKNGFLDNVANLCSVRFNLSKAIEEAESSEQLEFQGIQFINRMAEEFSLGVHGLEYLQKVTENLTVIQGVIKNQSESFNQTQKVKNLISDIENLNGTEFHLNSTDSWKMVFIEAAKIKNKAFEITEEDLKMNFHLPVHDAMTNTNVIVSDFNIHLENIRVASGIADNVQKLIHSVFYQKEVTKGNSLKEGINQGFE